MLLLLKLLKLLISFLRFDHTKAVQHFEIVKVGLMHTTLLKMRFILIFKHKQPQSMDKCFSFFLGYYFGGIHLDLFGLSMFDPRILAAFSN